MIKTYVKVKDRIDQGKNRIKNALSGKKGASLIELVVWFSVVLVVATLLFVF